MNRGENRIIFILTLHSHWKLAEPKPKHHFKAFVRTRCNRSGAIEDGPDPLIWIRLKLKRHKIISTLWHLMVTISLNCLQSLELKQERAIRQLDHGPLTGQCCFQTDFHFSASKAWAWLSKHDTPCYFTRDNDWAHTIAILDWWCGVTEQSRWKILPPWRSIKKKEVLIQLYDDGLTRFTQRHQIDNPINDFKQQQTAFFCKKNLTEFNPDLN